MRNTGNRWCWLFAALCAGSAWGTAQAAPPNDNWNARTAIAALPFSTSLPGVEQATSESTDPELFCVILGRATAGANSVWYEFTTGSSDQFVDLNSSGYDTIIGVYEGSPTQGFAVARGGCNDDGAGSQAGSRIVGLRLRANTRYSIVIARYPPNEAPAMTLSFGMAPSRIYTVSKTQDSNDGNCDSDCSLREAVQISGTQPGAIVLPAGTYAVPGGLAARGGGGIYGAGRGVTLIDAQGSGRVLVHRASQGNNTYALHDLTLANGLGSSTGDGGAFSGAGGHYVLDHVALRDSTSGRDGGGMALAETSTLSMYDSIVAGNVAQNSGGGIYCNGDNMEIYESAIIGNQTLAAGDATGGGGIFFEGRVEMRLVNSTVSGNRSAGEGGGFYLDLGGGGQRNIINNSSIVNNEFGPSSTVARQGGLLLAYRVASVRDTTISNSVLAGNFLGGSPGALYDCARSSDAIVPVTGYNLVQSANTCLFGATGDQTGIDPQLQPLDTALPMPVHLPANGSPLIDAGDPGSSCARADALGTTRPLDGNGDGTALCDIGAVEVRGERIFADGFE